MLVAVAVGWLVYRRNFQIKTVTIFAFGVTLLSVWAGTWLPTVRLSLDEWSYILLFYCFLASVLPVWLLLQPRDFVNSLLLYLGLTSIFLGFFLLNPQFAAPAVQAHPEGAPPMFPFVFIVIACGAISGFHGLVSSGTTAKQIAKETDATFIGYGGMIGESLLGLVAVLACTAGFQSRDLWTEHYQSWNLAQGLGPNMSAFINGSATFLSQLGVSMPLARAFVALVAVSFALTTLDSATRLLRFNISEISDTLRFPFLGNRYVASVLAVVAIGFFAFYRIGGQPAGLALWQLFGTTNQVMGALTLLAVTLYLMKRGRNYWFTGLPMLFMMVTTVIAMLIKLGDFWDLKTYPLLVVGAGILLLSLWLALEAVLRVIKIRQERAQAGFGT